MNKEMKKTIIKQIKVMQKHRDSLVIFREIKIPDAIYRKNLKICENFTVDARRDMILMEFEIDHQFPASQVANILSIINFINCKPITGNFFFHPLRGTVLSKTQVMVCKDRVNKAELYHSLKTLKHEFLENYFIIFKLLVADNERALLSEAHFSDSPLFTNCQ